MEQSENILDNIAMSYDEIHNEWKTLEGMVRNYEFNIFFSYVRNNRNVLEIGLGDGVFTKLLADNFEKVIAVDGSIVTIDNVKQRLICYDNIEYIHSFIENLILNYKVDNIVMSHILEHLDNPVESLKRLKNILAEDCIIYISVPNAMSLHRQVAVKMGLLKQVSQLNETDIKLGHKRVYKPREFLSDIEEAGYKIIKWGGVMIKPLTNKQIESTWTTEMINGFLKLGEDYPELCGDLYVVATIL